MGFRRNQPAAVRGLALGSLAEEIRRRSAASSSLPAHPSASGGKCLAAVPLPVFALVEPVDPRNFGYWPRAGGGVLWPEPLPLRPGYHKEQ